ncbi:E3 ubiquitin-protein ligase RNF138 [Pleurodeles waltl]|uniref:E3 ubiquitin-protein ligase RNF138 n=1 Tax=Pleurodeles waltl TaxID=8319 RepID=UPI0037094CD0
MATASQSLSCRPDEDFYCPICQEVFQTPVKTVACDHVFCKKCFQTAMKAGAVCPLCRGKISHREIATPQRAASIDEDMRKCYGRCKCCGQQVKYYRMRQHYTTCWKYQEEYGSPTKLSQAHPRTLSLGRSQLFECPVCKRRNLDRKSFVAHFNREHSYEAATLECPICASLPWAEHSMERSNLLDHLNRRHRFDYDDFMSPHLDEDAQFEAALAESYLTNF